MSDNPDPTVACTLDEDRREDRAAQVREALLPRYAGATEREDGYTVAFDGADETVPAVGRFVAEERQCCAFADYRIEVAPPYEETRLTITGPEGTKGVFREFVDRLEAGDWTPAT